MLYHLWLDSRSDTVPLSSHKLIMVDVEREKIHTTYMIGELPMYQSICSLVVYKNAQDWKIGG